MKQPTLRAFVVKRAGLEGFQKQAGGGTTSSTTAEVTGGRNVMTRPTISNKGRFGDKTRRG